MQLPHAAHFSRSMCMPPRLFVAIPAWSLGEVATRDCAAANPAVSADDVRKSLRFIVYEKDLILTRISVFAILTNIDCTLKPPPLEPFVSFLPTQATPATHERATSASSGYEETGKRLVSSDLSSTSPFPLLPSTCWLAHRPPIREIRPVSILALATSPRARSRGSGPRRRR